MVHYILYIILYHYCYYCYYDYIVFIIIIVIIEEFTNDNLSIYIYICIEIYVSTADLRLVGSQQLAYIQQYRGRSAKTMGVWI